MWIRVFLLVMALGWMPYGVFCLIFPEALVGIAGVEAKHASAVTELRAMYGGLQVAVGLSALLGFFHVLSFDKALLIQLVAVGGLASGRSIGAVVTGDGSFYTVGALAVEWLIVGICIAAVRSLSTKPGQAG